MADSNGSGAPASPPTGEDWLETRDIVGVVLTLSTLALAFPVLDLLGRNAAFFVAHEAPAWVPVGLAAMLAFGLPLIIVAVLAGVRRGAPRAGGWAVLGAVAVLAAITVVQALDRLAPAHEARLASVLGGGALAGAAAALAFRRSRQLRSVLRLGPLVPLAACGMFLFASPVAGLVLPQAAASFGAGGFASTPPIVMIVLDEFPVTSVMAADGTIDPQLYPTFARLASDGTWYRNAVTVDSYTTQALPALLTGKYPAPGQLAITADHPNNLFTLLSDAYQVHALESVTELCPDEVCGDDDRPARTAASVWTLGSDVGVVAAHVLLPGDLDAYLPPIGDAWGGFAAADDGSADPGAEQRSFAERFNSSVKDGRLDDFEWLTTAISEHVTDDRPTAFFLHTLLPHSPWEYLPSRQAYPYPAQQPGLTDDGWSDDDWLVAQAHQRHLLQAGAADALVGDVIETLERQGSYDDAMVIVTADHGAVFRTGRHRREIVSDTLGDIAAVPLFVKYPAQAHRGVSDAPVETVDVLPTIADVLGARDAWPTDGRPLEGARGPEREQQRIWHRGEQLAIPADGSERDASLAHKLDVFGERGGRDSLYRFGPHSDLVGRSAAELGAPEPSAATVTLTDPAAYTDVDPEGESLPTLVAATATADDRLDTPTYFAVAVNGTVEAVAKTFEHDGRRARLSAMIPPDSLRAGPNEIRFLQIAQ
jgi:arylsulfatase A-like enzyme